VIRADEQARKRTPEADLERAASELLALEGWRALKTDPTSDRSRAKGFGEPGMADSLYIRYGCGDRPGYALSDARRNSCGSSGKCPRAAQRCTNSPGVPASRPARPDNRPRLSLMG
jgi:hypothetical protein